MPTYIQGTFIPEISISMTFNIEFDTTGNLEGRKQHETMPFLEIFIGPGFDHKQEKSDKKHERSIRTEN